jgi:hypothetical protein
MFVFVSNLVGNMSVKTVVFVLFVVWVVSMAAFSQESSAATVRPYTHIQSPPKGVDWGCGVGRPIAKTRSGTVFCPLLK